MINSKINNQAKTKKILIVKTKENRLRIILQYDDDIITRIKLIPYSLWDSRNRWWTIPYSETYKEDIISYAKELSYSVIYREESISGIVPRRSRDSIINYRECPKEMLLKLKELRYSNNTVKIYSSMFCEFINYYSDKDIDKIDDRMIVNFLRYLVIDRKVSSSYQNQSINAIKFYYEKVLGGPRKIYSIDRPRKERTLPVVLSKEEVKQLLDAVVNIKHKAILMTGYSAGLRVGEIINLKWQDIDRDRMQIRIEQSKGRKDRYTKLSERLLPVLENYFRAYRTTEYIFEGAKPGTRYSSRSIQNIVKRAAAKAGIRKHITAHTLRHSFATHCLESGVDLRYIQSMLGHENSKTTEVYTHITTKGFSQIKSPLDEI